MSGPQDRGPRKAKNGCKGGKVFNQWLHGIPQCMYLFCSLSDIGTLQEQNALERLWRLF
jgi:hypothetical protein